MTQGEFTGALQEWLQERDFDKIVNERDFLTVYRDFSVLAAWHLIGRLVDPKTPVDVKDRIALTFAPRLTAELKGKLGVPGGGGSPMQGLLGAYRVG